MQKNNEKKDEDVLFTIKELAVVQAEDGSFNLKIKPNEELVKFFTFAKKGRKKLKNKTKFNLTRREKDVLKLLVQGKNNSQIGRELFVSKYTVKAHVANILQKLGVEDRVQAVVKVISEEII